VAKKANDNDLMIVKEGNDHSFSLYIEIDSENSTGIATKFTSQYRLTDPCPEHY
jgi:hypothetical protein